MSYWRSEYDDGWWTFYKDGIEIKLDNLNFGDLIVDEINNANQRIAELESKQRWISVKERLPELDEDVFVLLENGIGYGCLSEYKGKINWHLDFDAYGNEVYYWMPIPDEPGVNNA